MWTKLRNVVRAVAQFQQAAGRTSSRSAARVSGEDARLGDVDVLAPASLTRLSVAAAAVANGDDLSHGSADSSTEATGEERCPGDAADNGQSAGRDAEDVPEERPRLHRLSTPPCLCPAGRQSDQGYGSKDELHQDPADPRPAVAPDDQDGPTPQRKGETNPGSGTPRIPAPSP